MFGISAWIVIGDDENDATLGSRVCFPRRICIAWDAPTETIAKSQLRIAGCVVNIDNRLFVLSACKEGFHPDYNEHTEGAPQLGIKQCVRLGRVVVHPGAGLFTLIEVADTFRPCRRDGRCSECMTSIDKEWIWTKARRSGAEDEEELDDNEVEVVELTAFNKKGGPAKTHAMELSYNAWNDDQESFEYFDCHMGNIKPGSKLALTDSGSLVSLGGQYIGMSACIMPELGSVSVSVLSWDEKLWAYLTDVVQGRRPQERAQSGWLQETAQSETRVWKHLDWQQ